MGAQEVLHLMNEINNNLIKPHVVVLKIEVSCKCSCNCPPKPPVGPPAPQFLFSQGDTVTMIQFKVTAKKPSADTKTINFKYIETPVGQPANEVKTASFDADGSYDLDVADGARVEYWGSATDGSGNTGPEGPHGIIESAADTTAPGALDVPTVGPGDTAPPIALALSKGKKIS